MFVPEEDHIVYVVCIINNRIGHRYGDERRSAGRPPPGVDSATSGVWSVWEIHVLEGQSRLPGKTGDRDPREQEREILDEIAELTTGGDIVVDTHLVEGQPHEAITDHVDENNIDLVVMSRHGRSGVRERLLGTVTASRVLISKFVRMASAKRLWAAVIQISAACF